MCGCEAHEHPGLRTCTCVCEGHDKYFASEFVVLRKLVRELYSRTDRLARENSELRGAVAQLRATG